jgi:hypothetical protein
MGFGLRSDGYEALSHPMIVAWRFHNDAEPHHIVSPPVQMEKRNGVKRCSDKKHIYPNNNDLITYSI